jgi:HEAT repeat protein
MLREARATLSRRDAFDPLVQSALSSLPVRLSENDVIAQLLQALDGNEHATIAPLIDELFAELRPWAIIPLLAWYSAAPASPARQGVERAITRIANRNMSELVRLLEHADTAVVRGAVTMARLVPSPAQVAPLTRLLTSTDHTLRMEVVAALNAIGSPGALKVLEAAVEDDVRDVRIGALRAISAHKYAAALPRLQSAVQRKAVRNADLSEKMAFFEAFGAVCGDAGIPTLDQVLNGRGLLGNRENAEIRACAAHALGMIGSPAAHRSLQKSLDAQEVVVRSAVSRALRGAS